MKFPPASALRRFLAATSALFLLSCSPLAHAGAMRTEYRIIGGPGYFPAGVDDKGNQVITSDHMPWLFNYVGNVSYSQDGGTVTTIGQSYEAGSSLRPVMSPSGTVALTTTIAPIIPNPSTPPTSRVSLFRNGATTDLGRLSPESSPDNPSYSVVSAINRNDDLAGMTHYADYRSTAFVSRVGTDGQRTYRELGSLGGSIWEVNDMNSSGQVVGMASTASGEKHAFVSGGDLGSTHLVDLGTLGGSLSGATGINEAGQIVGFSTLGPNPDNPLDTDQVIRAVLITDGTMQDLGALPGNRHSIANAINNSGMIVGRSMLRYSGPGAIATMDASESRAFLRYANGEMIDLNDLIDIPKFHLLSATGINDAGVIIGYGLFDMPNGPLSMGFTLTPVPEPSTLLVFAVAGAFVLTRRIRHGRAILMND